MFRDGKTPDTSPALPASLTPRVIRVYRALRGEIVHSASKRALQRVYRMPAAEALIRARRHVAIMGGAR